MSREEYEIECLRREEEMLDEESRANGQAVNEQRIDAMEEAMRGVEVLQPALHNCRHPQWKPHCLGRTIYNMLRGMRDESAMNLPKDHSLYMDQQGDEPNKKG